MRSNVAKVVDSNDFVSNPGDRYRVLYSPVVLPDGSIDLKESGKEDIQEYIDSFRDQTDIEYIISRIQVGDTSVLNSSVPSFGDFTDMPKTYAELLQVVIDTENEFYKLPLGVRNAFDNDYRKWLATTGSEEWIKKMDPVFNPRPVGFPDGSVIIDPDKPIEKEVISE